jgi:hypothetical protein
VEAASAKAGGGIRFGKRLGIRHGGRIARVGRGGKAEGYTPAILAKSAEAVEKEGDELPRTAPLEAGSRGKKE